MAEKRDELVDSCNFMGIRPIMMALPYPPVQVTGKNEAYANVLQIDYCGAVSEMSAITQYINNENRLSGENCIIAQTFLGIAMAEMMHLQKLGQLIVLLGKRLDFSASQKNGRQKLWTPEYLTLSTNSRQMIYANIEAEKAAIQQYRLHIKMIKDPAIQAMLTRIIQDEEYHIMTLNALLS